MGDAATNDLKFTRDKYLNGSHSTELHTVDIWQPDSGSIARGDGKLWLIYIHGGAWRDPMIDSKSFEPAVENVWNSSLKNSIAGFASINYRLSPYPSHPESPSSPEDPSRNVHYPAHLQDVGHALVYLEEKYQIDKRYLLVGHSAGATMAFELKNHIPVPAAILGIAGIYHFEAFIQAHSDIPVYKELMENAFPDKGHWESAAPYTNHVPDISAWEHVKAVIISHSDQDGLVEKEQASYMIERARMSPVAGTKVHFLKVSGTHDEIWGNGHILAGLIAKSVEILKA